jgi:hypothetical protein
MTEFAVGDRVRIVDLPSTKPYYAGRIGVVVWVNPSPLGRAALLTYRVRLDGMTAAGHVTFSPHELEPAPPAPP